MIHKAKLVTEENLEDVETLLAEGLIGRVFKEKVGMYVIFNTEVGVYGMCSREEMQRWFTQGDALLDGWIEVVLKTVPLPWRKDLVTGETDVHH